MQLFNPLHIILMIIMIISAIVIYLFYNRHELDYKKNVLEIICISNLVIEILRVFVIMVDKNYPYNFFDDLIINPIDLICIFSFIVYVLHKYKYSSALFYIGLIYSLLLIVFPSEKYFGNIFQIRNLLYYSNLYLNFLVCVLSVSIIDIKMKDILKNTEILFLITTIAFCVTSLISVFMLSDTVNYFYTARPENNLLFKLIYDLVPISYIYNLIIIVLFVVLDFGLYGLYKLLEKPINNLKHLLNANATWVVKGEKIIKKEIR